MKGNLAILCDKTGNLSIRLPQALKEALEAAAARENLSLSAFLRPHLERLAREPALVSAERWLRDLLEQADGSLQEQLGMPASQIEVLAEAAGIPKAALKNAVKRLGISKRRGSNRWYWRLK